MRVGSAAEEGHVALEAPREAVARAVAADVLDGADAAGGVVAGGVEDVGAPAALLGDREQRQNQLVGQLGPAVVVGVDDQLQVGKRLVRVPELVHEAVDLVQRRQ